MKILFVSLGCDKNRVDTEVMLGMLASHGHNFTDDELEELGGKQKRINISDNSLLGKIFGLFFDN